MPTTAGKVSRFTDVDVIVVGSLQIPRIDGYDDGTSITVAWQGDRNTVRPGNDGKDTFSETASRYAIVTLTLLESSDSIDDLDRWLESGLTQGITYVDKAGRTFLSSPSARVRQKTDVTKSAGVETRSFDIHCIGCEGTVD